MTDQELTEANRRIEELLNELESHPDAGVPPRVHELVRLLSGLYGAGLGRMLTLVGAHPHAGAPVVARLGEDPLVGSLLLLHDLHPLDLQARVARAVEHVRPFVAMRGASVTLLDASQADVRIRINIATPTGNAAAGDIARTIEEAIAQAAPDVARVTIERSDDAPPSPLIQISRGCPSDARITRARPAHMPAPGR